MGTFVNAYGRSVAEGFIAAGHMQLDDIDAGSTIDEPLERTTPFSTDRTTEAMW